MNTYRTFFRGQTVDFTAATTRDAQLIAQKHFKAKKPWYVSILLIEQNGVRVSHDTAQF